MKEILISENNHVGYKVRLFPTKEQQKIFNEYFGMSRFVYNLCINMQEEHYENQKLLKIKNKKRLSFNTLCKTFTELKKKKEYKWLIGFNANSVRGAIKDCCTAFKKYDNKGLKNKKPKYKSKIYSKKQFYTTSNRMSIHDNYINVPSIGKIKYCNSYSEEIVGSGDNRSKKTKLVQYYNPRISFDGINYYLSFTIPKNEIYQINSYYNYYNNEEWQFQESSEVIGIDVGVKNEKWFIDSTGNTVIRPNSNALNKKISRLQRKYDRQKKANLKKNSSFMEQHPDGSKNMQKTLAKINKCFKKITNRRRNVVHNYACDLLKLKPKAIVMESIKVKNMINKNNKNSKLKQIIYDAALYESMMIIEQKMINNGIPVIRAESDYPSSQICSCCGYRQNIGRKNIYSCPNCGTIINRDLNAAINLAKLAY